MRKNRRTLVLIRRGEREPTRYRVSPRRLAALITGLVTVLGGVALVGTLATSDFGRSELEALRRENEALRRANERFEQRLGDVRHRLAETEDRAQKLAIVAGLGNLAPAPEAGVGGPLVRGVGAEEALGVLEERTQRLADALTTVEVRLDENLRRLSATPSIWPVAGLLSSGFGTRRDPITGQRAFHSGVDLSAPPGRPVAVTASGIVVRTERSGGLGRAVFVSHGFGRTTVYGHLSRILVSPGQKVDRGETVGLVGNTGRSTGYHLHYEVRVDGKSVNPLPYLLAAPASGS